MKINLYEAWLILLLIMATGIVLIFPVSLDTWRHFLAISSMGLIGIYALTHRSYYVGEKNRHLYYYMFIYICIIVFEIINAYRVYGYSGYEIYYSLRQYVWVLLAIPLYRIVIRNGGIEKYVTLINNILLVSLLLRMFTWFCGSIIDINIFPDLLFEYGVSRTRNGFYRIDVPSIFCFWAPINFALFRKTRNWKNMFLVVVGFVYVCLVSQTRMLIAGYFVCVVSMIFFERRSSGKRFLVQMSVILCACALYTFGFFDFILSRFDFSTGSLGYRMYEFKYFLSLLQEKKWMLGLGILTESNVTSSAIMYGNTITKMYIDDLGAFASFLQFGLLSFVLYLPILGHIIRVLKKCREQSESTYATILIGLLFYLLFVSISLDLFGSQRIFSVGVILSFVAVVEYELETGNRDDKQLSIDVRF